MASGRSGVRSPSAPSEREAPARGLFLWGRHSDLSSEHPQGFPLLAGVFPQIASQSAVHAAMFQIGPSLREARMRRGFSPADVHKAVRIRERYLTALEEERWEMLPGDAYTKGFLRTYAEFLGLDGQLYIDEYNARVAVHEEAPLVPEALSKPRSRARRSSSARPAPCCWPAPSRAALPPGAT